MMNKTITKTVKNIPLLSAILAILLAAAIVVVGLFGVNYAPTLKNCNALTVTVNTKAFEDKLEQIEDKCEAAFENAGVDYSLVKYSQMSGDDCEIVYEFDESVNLTAVKAELAQTFATITSEQGEWNGSFISVSQTSEVLLTQLPTAYAVRAAVAVAVFSVLAFVYEALRYRLFMGIVAAVCSALGSLMATALVLLVRIPVSNSLLYISVLAAPVAVVLALFTFNKMRAAMQANQEFAVEETIACKEITAVAVLGGVALVLLGAIATTAVRWFAVAALVALIVAVFVGGLFAPAMCIPMKKAEDKRNQGKTKSGYVGAEKQTEIAQD